MRFVQRTIISGADGDCIRFHSGNGRYDMTHDEAFAKLSRSTFRSRFHLTAEMREYITDKGINTIHRHAEDFVRLRLAPAHPKNDGRQTPMKGHPVFIAQHATATCCRGCLSKWWKVPKGVALTEEQMHKIVCLIMAWIINRYNNRNLV